MFVVQIEDLVENQHKPYLEEYPMLQQFKYVFPEETLRLPPRRDIYFTIDLIPGVVQVSKSPYRMSIYELMDLKIQL